MEREKRGIVTFTICTGSSWKSLAKLSMASQSITGSGVKRPKSSDRRGGCPKLLNMGLEVGDAVGLVSGALWPLVGWLRGIL